MYEDKEEDEVLHIMIRRMRKLLYMSHYSFCIIEFCVSSVVSNDLLDASSEVEKHSQ